MTRILWFLSGVIAGVVGVFFYQVFGKPTLPKVKFPSPQWTYDDWHREWNKMLDLRDKQKAEANAKVEIAKHARAYPVKDSDGSPNGEGFVIVPTLDVSDVVIPLRGRLYPDIAASLYPLDDDYDGWADEFDKPFPSDEFENECKRMFLSPLEHESEIVTNNEKVTMDETQPVYVGQDDEYETQPWDEDYIGGYGR